MKSLKQPFILFFVAGMVPTPKERSAAQKLRGQVGWRNASAINEEDAPEPCDGVAALSRDLIPSNYKKFPTAESAIAKFDKELDDAVKLVGDQPPPQRAAATNNTVAGTANAPAGPDDKAPAGFEKLPGGDPKPPAWGTPPAAK